MTLDAGAVDVRRGQIQTEAGVVDGWVAEFDGTEGVGHGREEALRQLVINVAREGPL